MEENRNNLLIIQGAVPKLAEGILDLYIPNLQMVKKQLMELTKKQEVTCRELHDENLKLSEAHFNPDLQEMFEKIKVYREKLIRVKNKMAQLHDKSNRLKRRVLKLEQCKQNEAKQRAQQRDQEEQLIGKPPQS